MNSINHPVLTNYSSSQNLEESIMMSKLFVCMYHDRSLPSESRDSNAHVHVCNGSPQANYQSPLWFEGEKTSSFNVTSHFVGFVDNNVSRNCLLFLKFNPTTKVV